MKHVKIYEGESFSDMRKANIFSKKMQEKFFEKSPEFKEITSEWGGNSELYKFYVRFYKIFPEELKAIEKFCEYMGYSTSGWCIETKVFAKGYFPDVFFEFHIFPAQLDKILEKIQFEENIQKYNL